MNTIATWIALLLSIITTVVAVTVVIVQMRASVNDLTKANDDRQKREEEEACNQREREEKADKEMTEFLVLLKSFISTQTEINRRVEQALEGVMVKVEGLQQHVEQAITVKELLIEILRKRETLNIEP